MIKQIYYINGILKFGLHNEIIEYKNKEISAVSVKHVQFLLSKELHETWLKHMNKIAIYNLVKNSNLKITKHKF